MTAEPREDSQRKVLASLKLLELDASDEEALAKKIARMRRERIEKTVRELKALAKERLKKAQGELDTLKHLKSAADILAECLIVVKEDSPALAARIEAWQRKGQP